MFEPASPANTSVEFNLHTHKLSPYTDVPLKGKVVAAVVGGELTSMYGHLNKKPCGQLQLKRDD